MPLVSRSQGVDKTKETSITYTTLDVKQDYEILQVITGYSETTTTPVNNDSFLNVYTTAWAKLAGEAYKLKSDAVRLPSRLKIILLFRILSAAV